MEKSDIRVAKNLSATGDFYDIGVDPDTGDLFSVESFDSSLGVSLLTDARASESEIGAADLRRGWWFNVFATSNLPSIGSKLWLLNQSRNTPETLNRGIGYIQNALKWLVDLGYAQVIEVNGSQVDDSIVFVIRIIVDQDIVIVKNYTLWLATGDSELS